MVLSQEACPFPVGTFGACWLRDRAISLHRAHRHRVFLGQIRCGLSRHRLPQASGPVSLSGQCPALPSWLRTCAVVSADVGATLKDVVGPLSTVCLPGLRVSSDMTRKRGCSGDNCFTIRP